MSAVGVETCDARYKLMKFRVTGDDKVETLQETSLRVPQAGA